MAFIASSLPLVMTVRAFKRGGTWAVLQIRYSAGLSNKLVHSPPNYHGKQPPQHTHTEKITILIIFCYITH